jgi:hypothetical protein
MPLEILNGALVLLRGGAACKRAQIAPPAGLRIYFTRIEPVFAGRKFADHGDFLDRTRFFVLFSNRPVTIGSARVNRRDPMRGQAR